jgi:hypothetical protein
VNTHIYVKFKILYKRITLYMLFYNLYFPEMLTSFYNKSVLPLMNLVYLISPVDGI